MGCKYGGPVKGCEEPKHWVKVINKSAPWLPEREAYKKQCQTCGAYGVMTSIKPAEEEMVIGEEQSESFKAQQQEKMARLQEERRLACGREKEEENARWQEGYKNYLDSPIWHSKRKLTLERDNHLCQACLKSTATQVHHVSYRGYNKSPGYEPAWELASICRHCHEREHGLLTEF